MRKSKHFRKDVIIARLIAAVILALLIWGISWLVSFLVKPSEGGNTQNTGSEYTEEEESESDDYVDIVPGDSESETTTEDQSESTTEDPSESEMTDDADRYVRTTARLNLRAEASTNGEILGVIEKGKEVLLLEELDGWYKVSSDGVEGYISAAYARIVE